MSNEISLGWHTSTVKVTTPSAVETALEATLAALAPTLGTDPGEAGA